MVAQMLSWFLLCCSSLNLCIIPINMTDTVTTPRQTPRMYAGVRIAYLIMTICALLANYHLLPVYIHMMLITVATIYIGSVYSVINLSDSSIQTEQMQTKDAYMFPVIGSVVLFSLYLVFKFLPKEYVNLAIKAYFFIFGVLVLGNKISTILESNLPINLAKALTKNQFRVRNPLSLFSKKDNKKPEETNAVNANNSAVAAAETPKNDDLIDFTVLDIISLLFSMLIGVWYLQTNHWAASNIFGIAFSIQGIELLSLGSYFNGCILLCGLFVYDIFWVFGTDVMVTVAKSFDAPIKLLFPQTLADSRPSMLGLGDIVIPGIFIALLLRFDLHRNKDKKSGAFPIYFYINLLSYFLGLSTTVGVMYYFLHAQPALLYLVPACLGASLITALARREFRLLWNYTEGDDTNGAAAKKSQ
jgi:minor histocompatibility antigen H13